MTKDGAEAPAAVAAPQVIGGLNGKIRRHLRCYVDGRQDTFWIGLEKHHAQGQQRGSLSEVSMILRRKSSIFREI